MESEWWRRAVVYQVYIRSFADGDGDGTGDIAGLRSRLGYLSRLGIDAIWLNPWYESPLRDGGYDVADYRKIDARFGTNDEAEAFVREAHDLGIRVIVDLVPNHTSDQHEWFAAARNATQGDPSRDLFHIRAGKGQNGDEPPNDWVAVFGGSAWERLDDGEWYLHLFDVSQPDLNWNNPAVVSEFDSILRFWLDRGVDGFRVDVAHGLMKDPTYRDYVDDNERSDSFTKGHPHWDRDDLHDVVRRWRSIVEDYDGDRMLLAEAWVKPDRLPLYVRPDEYHLSFSFDFATASWNASEFRSVISNSLAEASSVDAPATWVLSNHDIVRHSTRFGLPPGTNPAVWLLDGPHDALDEELGARRARAGCLMMLALPGTAYVYQGDELGLPEVWDLEEDVLDDPIWTLSGQTRKGRDGCRVPLPWSAHGTSFGFGSAAAWLPQPAAWGSFSVEAQEPDEGSALWLYRAAISIRRELFSDDSIVWLDLGPDVVAFRRGSGVMSVTNFGSAPIEVPSAELVLASGPFIGGCVGSDVTAWLRPIA